MAERSAGGREAARSTRAVSTTMKASVVITRRHGRAARQRAATPPSPVQPQVPSPTQKRRADLMIRRRCFHLASSRLEGRTHPGVGMQLDLEQLAVEEGSPQGPVATCDWAGERPGGNARPAPPPCTLPSANGRPRRLHRRSAGSIPAGSTLRGRSGDQQSLISSARGGQHPCPPPSRRSATVSTPPRQGGNAGSNPVVGASNSHLRCWSCLDVLAGPSSRRSRVQIPHSALRPDVRFIGWSAAGGRAARHHAIVAEWRRRLPSKQLYAGSIPAGRSKFVGWPLQGTRRAGGNGNRAGLENHGPASRPVGVRILCPPLR